MPTIDGTIRLSPNGIEGPRLGEKSLEQPGEPLRPGGAASTTDTESSIYNNITLGQARIMTGNVGVESWQKVSRRTTIAHNKFGDDVRIMAGDVSPEAAKDFISNLWS